MHFSSSLDDPETYFIPLLSDWTTRHSELDKRNVSLFFTFNERFLTLHILSLQSTVCRQVKREAIHELRNLPLPEIRYMKPRKAIAKQRTGYQI